MDSMNGITGHAARQLKIAKYSSVKSLSSIRSVWEIVGDLTEILEDDDIVLPDIDAISAGLLNALRHQVSKIQELEAIPEAASAVRSLREFQIRVAYASEIARNIDTGNRDDQYDPAELDEWARKTTDLTSGMSYSLYVFNRLILGSDVGGKPLAQFIFSLLEKDGKTGPRAGWFYGYLVAIQALAFGVLIKARQHLKLSKIKIRKELTKRVEVQIPVVMKSLQASHLDWSGWGIDYAFVGNFSRRIPKTGSATYLLTTGANRVVCGIESDQNDRRLFLRCGTLIPGTTGAIDIETEQIEYGTVQEVGGAWGLRTWASSNLKEEGYVLKFDAVPIVVGPEYAIVGIVYGNDPYTGWLYPLVSKWDPTTCRHEWDGENGRIFRAVRSRKDAKSLELKPGVHPRLCMADKVNRTEGMLRGVALQADDEGNARVACLSSGASSDAWLPLQFEASEDIDYGKVTLPKNTRRVEAGYYLPPE
ncbi:hypothetical protein BJY04DRAFT_196789 [Aspergillus karnatakaensis]|uniref:uncharacterized protein n=1 Tax=Aspergillus karnatakaensis TaxID=1810916 RepID=UPI003CCCCBF6